MVMLFINDTPVHMELDTGASVSLVSEETWRRQFHEIPLQETDVRLRIYTGESITVLGQALVKLYMGNRKPSYQYWLFQEMVPRCWEGIG